IVQPRGRAQTRCAVIGPEGSNFGLLGSSRSRGNDPIAAEAFYLVVSGGVLGAVQGGRSWTTELRRCCHDERTHLTPQRTEGERVLADWILAPHSRRVAGDKFDSHPWFGVAGAVVSPEGKHFGRASLAEGDAFLFRPSVRRLA